MFYTCDQKIVETVQSSHFNHASFMESVGPRKFRYEFLMIAVLHIAFSYFVVQGYVPVSYRSLAGQQLPNICLPFSDSTKQITC